MCRSIKVLRRPGDTPSTEELRAAALQYVRKISGFNKPSVANKEAFDLAVEEITAAGARLLEAIHLNSQARGTKEQVAVADG